MIGGVPKKEEEDKGDYSGGNDEEGNGRRKKEFGMGVVAVAVGGGRHFVSVCHIMLEGDGFRG